MVSIREKCDVLIFIHDLDAYHLFYSNLDTLRILIDKPMQSLLLLPQKFVGFFLYN